MPFERQVIWAANWRNASSADPSNHCQNERTMNCQLCQRDTELMNSHIIPEFVYEPLYDEAHRFHVLSSLEPKKKVIDQKGSENTCCVTTARHIFLV